MLIPLPLLLDSSNCSNYLHSAKQSVVTNHDPTICDNFLCISELPYYIVIYQRLTLDPTLILLFLFFLSSSIFFVLQGQNSSNCMTTLQVKRRERLNVEKTLGTAWHIKWNTFLALFDPDHPASETLLPVHKRSTATNLRKCFMLSLSFCACKTWPHIRVKRGSPHLQ